MKFDAPWGRELTVLTSITTAMMLGLAAFVWSKGGELVAALLLTLHAIPLALTVRSYEIAPGELRIRRLLWDTRWPLDAASTATPRPDAMVQSWRLWGNGGVFAFSGHFSNAALGRYRAFVTDFKRTVVIRTARGTVVVSPDRPQEFAAAFGKRTS